jgi:D-3-phosphoglycerate dehydrogenase
LREGWIAGAAIDVFPSEPPPPDHPLLALDNVILSPHFASFTHEGVMRMSMDSAEQVLMVLRGERPPNLVNPVVWEKRR